MQPAATKYTEPVNFSLPPKRWEASIFRKKLLSIANFFFKYYPANMYQERELKQGIDNSVFLNPDLPLEEQKDKLRGILQDLYTRFFEKFQLDQGMFTDISFESEAEHLELAGLIPNVRRAHITPKEKNRVRLVFLRNPGSWKFDLHLTEEYLRKDMHQSDSVIDLLKRRMKKTFVIDSSGNLTQKSFESPGAEREITYIQNVGMVPQGFLEIGDTSFTTNEHKSYNLELDVESINKFLYIIYTGVGAQNLNPPRSAKYSSAS